MARKIDSVNSQTTTDAPSSMQRRTQYSANGTILYIGYAPYGYGAGEDVWTIYTFTYDADLREILKQTAFDSWSNRSGAAYA